MFSYTRHRKLARARSNFRFVSPVTRTKIALLSEGAESERFFCRLLHLRSGFLCLSHFTKLSRQLPQASPFKIKTTIFYFEGEKFL